MKTFHFLSDSGHGWLRVTHSDLAASGVSGEISHYSYKNGNFVYLEEDCDAPEFLDAIKAQGVEYQIREHKTVGNSIVRTYKSFC